MPETGTEQEAPSLYEHFQDTEVTVFGMTGTLGELSDMCPVPVEQRSPAAMDKFAAKVLQASGVEIPEQFGAVVEPQQTEKQIHETTPAVAEKPLPTLKPEKPMAEEPEPANLAVDDTYGQLIQNAEYQKQITAHQEQTSFSENIIIEDSDQPKPPKATDKPKPLPTTPRQRAVPVNEVSSPSERSIGVVEGESYETPAELPTSPKPETPVYAKPPEKKVRVTAETEIISKPTVVPELAVPMGEDEPEITKVELPVAQPVATIAEIMLLEAPAIEMPAVIEQTEEPVLVLEELALIDQLTAELPESDYMEFEEPAIFTMAEAYLPAAESPLAAVLPESMQEKLAEYQETSDPEEAIIAASLTIFLENAITQLDELQAAEIVDEIEIAEIEGAIIEVYDELLQAIGVEDNEERQVLVKWFIAELKIRHQRTVPEEECAFIEDNEGTHEQKRTFSSLFGNNPSLIVEETNHLSLGRFTLAKAQSWT